MKWFKHIIEEYLFSVILAVIFVFVINQFIMISRVSGSSMYPTLCNGDIAVFSKVHLDELKEDDIVALRYNDEYLVKRIIAMHGDKVHIEEGGIYVNGEKVVDAAQSIGFHINTVDYALKDNELFVVGDNSVKSYDSRMFGPIDKSTIMGKYIYCFPYLFESKH